MKQSCNSLKHRQRKNRKKKMISDRENVGILGPTTTTITKHGSKRNSNILQVWVISQGRLYQYNTPLNMIKKKKT